MNTDLKTFLEMGGSISFGYKTGLYEWFEDVQLAKSCGIYMIYGGRRYETFPDFDSAFRSFAADVLGPNNLAIVFRRLKNKNMIDPDELDGILECNRSTIRDKEGDEKLQRLIIQEREAMRMELMVHGKILSETEHKILMEINSSFPDYPANLTQAVDGNDILCVNVFCVPDDQVRIVKDFIHRLDDLISKDGPSLLPMVKNIEITKQHYPQHFKEPK